MRAPVTTRHDEARLIEAWTHYEVACPECGARVGKPCTATIGALGTGVVGVPIRGVHLKRLPLGETELA